jgi:hypothetical protein
MRSKTVGCVFFKPASDVAAKEGRKFLKKRVVPKVPPLQRRRFDNPFPQSPNDSLLLPTPSSIQILPINKTAGRTSLKGALLRNSAYFQRQKAALSRKRREAKQKNNPQRISLTRSNYNSMRSKGYLNPVIIAGVEEDNSCYVSDLGASDRFQASIEGSQSSALKDELKNSIRSLKYYRCPTPDQLRRQSSEPNLLRPMPSLHNSMAEHNRNMALRRRARIPSALTRRTSPPPRLQVKWNMPSAGLNPNVHAHRSQPTPSLQGSLVVSPIKKRRQELSAATGQ